MQAAKDAGADAALVVVPYYNKPSQAGLAAHFRRSAESSDLPIIVYNVPSRTVADISVETLAEVSRLPNVVGVKDATGNLARVTAQRLACGEDVRPAVRQRRHGARLQRDGRRGLHFGDRQRRAAALRGFPGGDAREGGGRKRWSCRTGSIRFTPRCSPTLRRGRRNMR